MDDIELAEVPCSNAEQVAAMVRLKGNCRGQSGCSPISWCLSRFLAMSPLLPSPHAAALVHRQIDRVLPPTFRFSEACFHPRPIPPDSFSTVDDSDYRYLPKDIALLALLDLCEEGVGSHLCVCVCAGVKQALVRAPALRPTLSPAPALRYGPLPGQPPPSPVEGNLPLAPCIRTTHITRYTDALNCRVVDASACS